MKKTKVIARIAGIGIGVALLVLFYCGYAIGHFKKNIEQMEVKRMEERVEIIDNTLFGRNIYLSPDTAYFYKLENLLKTGKLKDDEGTFASMIQKNIGKGVIYDSNIHSVYLALAEEEAPYVLVNGLLREKTAMTDMEWWEICCGMQSDCYMNWRTISSSYLNKVSFLSVYRSYNSMSYQDGRIIRGYIVINYYQNSILNEINALSGSQEKVIFYNPVDGDVLIPEGVIVPETKVRELLAGDKKSGVLTEGRGKDARNFIYCVKSSGQVPLEYILFKADTEMDRVIADTYLLFLGTAFLVCVGIIVLILLSYRQHRKYLYGLVKVISATEQEEGSEEEMMTTLMGGFAGRELDLEIIARRILDDSMDLNELTKVLQSEQRLRTEVEMLYGNAQINSHFLLNSLDSIYWESLKNQGRESEETKMIEQLCTILKYALDSSNPYISLKEEVECARNYLVIQGLRKKKRIEADWIIPKELEKALVGKLMLQPILENSIQHGTPAMDELLYLSIEARLLEETLYLFISDNGTGIEENEMRRMNQMFRQEVPVKSKHIGLLNVNRRLQLQYGEEYGIVLQPSPGGKGLMVVLRLKYITTGKEEEEVNGTDFKFD
ncbi:histidine kinase [Lachnospiraceae bacterium 54-11]